jgi:hypothetical protein
MLDQGSVHPHILAQAAGTQLHGAMAAQYALPVTAATAQQQPAVIKPASAAGVQPASEQGLAWLQGKQVVLAQVQMGGAEGGRESDAEDDLVNELVNLCVA